MPTILLANPKGGCGKSTTGLVLATQLNTNGTSVRIIDADPQQTIGEWAKGESKHKSIVVGLQPGEDLLACIDRLEQQVAFVIIDVQGTQNEEIGQAMSRADLVLIPIQAKHEDARLSAKAIALIDKQQRMFRRTIPHMLVFTRTSVLLQTREEKSIIQNIRARGIPHLETKLCERTAYSAMMWKKLGLDELDQTEVNGVNGAVDNARALTAEVIQTLRSRKEAA